MIGVSTHAFDFYYKTVPTASNAILAINWYNDTYFDFYKGNIEYVRRWFNFGPGDVPSNYPYILTRNTPQLSASIYQNGALAWGSAASDYLWNVLTPTMSSVQQSIISGRCITSYRFTYNSHSFYYGEYGGIGVNRYPITSSWIAYEPRMINVASGSTSAGYSTNGGPSAYFPAVILTPGVYSLPSVRTTPQYDPFVGENPTHITYGSNSTGSNDGRFFDLAGGCGITKSSISASLVLYETNKASTTVPGRQLVATSLKNRRLFFPTVRTGSMPEAPGSPGIWFQKVTGRPSSDVFTENGGIYNVRFNIKRDITNGYDPDEGSELLVYIHNVNAMAPVLSNRLPGADGWYPPEANIVRIKNTPENPMQFDNPGNQYKIESFNINVVQYGFPAQLVFEASGSLNSNSFFGCIIDDVQFCKIGVTTDPALIKPTTTGGTLFYQDYARDEGIVE